MCDGRGPDGPAAIDGAPLGVAGYRLCGSPGAESPARLGRGIGAGAPLVQSPAATRTSACRAVRPGGPLTIGLAALRVAGDKLLVWAFAVSVSIGRGRVGAGPALPEGSPTTGGRALRLIGPRRVVAVAY